MKLNMERAAQLLFTSKNADDIVEDYALPREALESPEGFLAALIEGFQQPVRGRPLVDPPEVFEAAVNAIASNSRRWTTFVKGDENGTSRRALLKEELGGYRPDIALDADDSKVASYLGGQELFPTPWLTCGDEGGDCGDDGGGLFG